MSFELLDRYFPILFGLSLLWVTGWVVASILYRRKHDKPIVFRNVPNATFAEDTASGHSNRTWFTKLGGANRCLVVAVAGNRLIIRPRFPFNLMFLPEIYGLEHDVSADQITHVELNHGRSGAIRLEFRDSDHTLHDVTLHLRNPAEFVRAIGKHAA
jgi:hypothetical protein